MLGFGLWWLRAPRPPPVASGGVRHGWDDFGRGCGGRPVVRERATTAQAFDPAEIRHGEHAERGPPILFAVLPLIVVVGVNLLMSFAVLPRLDVSYLAEDRWGSTSLSAVAGVWSVAVALAAAILTVVVLDFCRLQTLRATIDAGANASVLPIFSVASLVGFGAVVAAIPGF